MVPAHDVFEGVAPRLDPPMLIVTAETAGDRSGCLVGFHSQASIDPQRYLVMVSTANHTWTVARDAAHVVVHFCDERDRPLARLFGGETGDEVDKFARCAWEPSPSGAPVLTDCRNWLEGRVVDRHELGDHVGFLLEWTSGAHAEDFRPLRLSRVDDVEPGHPA